MGGPRAQSLATQWCSHRPSCKLEEVCRTSSLDISAYQTSGSLLLAALWLPSSPANAPSPGPIAGTGAGQVPMLPMGQGGGSQPHAEWPGAHCAHGPTPGSGAAHVSQAPNLAGPAPQRPHTTENLIWAAYHATWPDQGSTLCGCATFGGGSHTWAHVGAMASPCMQTGRARSPQRTGGQMGSSPCRADRTRH